MVSSHMDDLRRVREQLEEAEESAQVQRGCRGERNAQRLPPRTAQPCGSQLTEKESELEAGTSAKLKSCSQPP